MFIPIPFISCFDFKCGVFIGLVPDLCITSLGNFSAAIQFGTRSVLLSGGCPTRTLALGIIIAIYFILYYTDIALL